MILSPIFSNIPDELKQHPQWVNWRLLSRKDGGKPTKPPYQPDGRLAKTDDSSTWSTFSMVESAAPQHDGIGFVLTKNNPYVGLDFDHCRCPAFDGIMPWASSLDTVLPEIAEHIRKINSYTEISPSGKGIRVFLKGTLPVDGKRKGPIEAYQSGRYVTVTGHVLDGLTLAIEDRQEALDAFFQDVFGTSENSPEQKTSYQQVTSNVDWKERLEKALQSKNGEEIRKLYYGDQSAYSSHSEADLALCSKLAFWLNGDPALIDTAFRESALMRDKWNESHYGDGRTYGEATISKALTGCKLFYSDRQTKIISYDELLSRITTTENIGILVNEVAQDVRESGLSKTEIHNLIKVIAKKTGGTIQTLYNDTQITSDTVTTLENGTCGKGGDKNFIDKIDHLQTANVIVAAYGRENLAFVSDQRIFRRWDGRAWIELDDRSINSAVVEYFDGKTNKVTKNVIESITDLIRTRVFREGVIWDADTSVIPVQNGELAWNGNGWTLTPHVREHYRTTLIPVEYDPEARAPRFEQFLEEIFRNDPDCEEKCILICEMIGYTLTTSCEYEKFIMLIGPGANGKSVLLDVIRLLVGPKQVAAVQPDQMDNRFQRAHLCGKLANIVTEIKEGGEIADAALKAITSGELTTAEHKFKKPFDFQPFSTCWFGTNHMPHTRDFSDALFRRALIVEFNRVFQEHEQDKKLKQKLADELPGILNLALTAFGGVIKCGQFTIPESCVRAKEDWRTEADQVAQFIKEQCTLDKNSSVPSGVLYSTYRSWAEAAGISRMLNKINFSKRIQRLGGKLDRTGKSRLIAGIRLTQGGDNDEYDAFSDMDIHSCG